VIPAWLLRELTELADRLDSSRTRAGTEFSSVDELMRYVHITGWLSAECESAAIDLRALVSALRAHTSASETTS
jgi:hypothetical protein